MTFQALSSCLASLQEATADKTAGDENSSPAVRRSESAVVSDSEYTRFDDKLIRAIDKLDELIETFKETPSSLSGPAHKLHHLGMKAGLDMSYLDDIRTHLKAAQTAAQDMHMAWSLSMRPNEDSSS